MEPTNGVNVTTMDTRLGTWIATCLLVLGAASGAAAGQMSGSGMSGVTLEWTAPGDDGYQGEATGYDLRYSFSPISEQNFDQATRASGVPEPAPAGTRQSARIVGLESSRVYYFALKSVDDAGNWSLLSNVTFKTAPDPTTSHSLFPLSISPPFPSPARDHIRIEMTLPRDMVVHVNVIDVCGRQVQTLAEGHYPAGNTELQWNLLSERGVRLVGQYWILGELGGASFTHRLTVVR
jgi:hypothetical protein